MGKIKVKIRGLKGPSPGPFTQKMGFTTGNFGKIKLRIN